MCDCDKIIIHRYHISWVSHVIRQRNSAGRCDQTGFLVKPMSSLAFLVTDLQVRYISVSRPSPVHGLYLVSCQRNKKKTPRSPRGTWWNGVLPTHNAANDPCHRYRPRKSPLLYLNPRQISLLPIPLQVRYVLSLAHEYRGRATRRRD